MPEDRDQYKNRIIQYVQRIDQARTELAQSIEWAQQYTVSPQFVKDASSLVDLLPELSYIGFLEYTREIPYYLKKIKEFILKWDSKSSSPGYSEVLRCARKCGSELRTTQLAFREMRDVIPDIVEPAQRKELGISLVSVVVLVVIMIFFMIVVILSIME